MRIIWSSLIFFLVALSLFFYSWNDRQLLNAIKDDEYYYVGDIEKLVSWMNTIVDIEKVLNDPIYNSYSLINNAYNNILSNDKKHILDAIDQLDKAHEILEDFSSQNYNNWSVLSIIDKQLDTINLVKSVWQVKWCYNSQINFLMNYFNVDSQIKKILISLQQVENTLAWFLLNWDDLLNKSCLRKEISFLSSLREILLNMNLQILDLKWKFEIFLSDENSIDLCSKIDLKTTPDNSDYMWQLHNITVLLSSYDWLDFDNFEQKLCYSDDSLTTNRSQQIDNLNAIVDSVEKFNAEMHSETEILSSWEKVSITWDKLNTDLVYSGHETKFDNIVDDDLQQYLDSINERSSERRKELDILYMKNAKFLEKYLQETYQDFYWDQSDFKEWSSK